MPCTGDIYNQYITNITNEEIETYLMQKGYDTDEEMLQKLMQYYTITRLNHPIIPELLNKINQSKHSANSAVQNRQPGSELVQQFQNK